MARDGHHRSQITLLSHLMKNGNHLFLQMYNTLMTYNGSPLNLNTNGPEKSLHISEQTLFWAMQELFLGKDNVSEVSLERGSTVSCLQTYCVYDGLLLGTGQDVAILALKGKEVSSWCGWEAVSPRLRGPASSWVTCTLVHPKLGHLRILYQTRRTDREGAEGGPNHVSLAFM